MSPFWVNIAWKRRGFSVRVPQTKYLGAVLAVSLIPSIPAPLWWSGRAVSVQRAHKHSTVFSACSGIDLQFVCCHHPFSSSLFLLSVRRKRGAILNVSSASGMYPVPLLTVYSASKVIARQSIWPFPHLLNWNLIIGDMPPPRLKCAAAERRLVWCLFFLGSLLSAAFQNENMCPVHQLGVHLLARPAWSWSVLPEWRLAGTRASCGWGGSDPLAFSSSSVGGLPRWPLASLPLGTICGCPLQTWPSTCGLPLWHVFTPPIILWQRRSGSVAAFHTRYLLH